MLSFAGLRLKELSKVLLSRKNYNLVFCRNLFFQAEKRELSFYSSILSCTGMTHTSRHYNTACDFANSSVWDHSKSKATATRSDNLWWPAGEKSHRECPQNEKSNECQTCCHAHTALFVPQNPSYTHCAASAPLGKFHQLRIKHNNVFPCFKAIYRSDLIPCESSAWNEWITLVTWSLHQGFPSALALKFREKVKSGQIEDQKRNTDQQQTASAPHLGVKREMEEN